MASKWRPGGHEAPAVSKGVHRGGDRRCHGAGPAHTFDAFRLEPPPGGLWRGDVRLALRPRSLAMLRYLVAHAGRLVTKAELRQHVWGGTHVSDTVLRVCVQEIRAALGDAAAAPQYLETVEPQGYRFRVGERRTTHPLTAGPIVGRQQDVARLEDWFQRATQGTRQLVFVSGDVGMGKTTVVDQFLAHCAAGNAGRIGRGSAPSTMARGNRTCRSSRRCGSWATAGARRDPGGAAAVCAPVAGAAPGAGERAGAGTAPAPGGRGDPGPHAPRTRPGARRADGRRPWCSCSKTCSGVTGPRWTSWPTWRSGGSRRSCWCSGRIARWTSCSTRTAARPGAGAGGAGWCANCPGAVARRGRGRVSGGAAGGRWRPPSWRASTRAPTAIPCSW